MALDKQYQFWKKHNGSADMKIPSETELELAKLLEAEQTAHELTKEALSEGNNI